MRQLGHSQFFVVGDNRGGRVAHRMCLDHPDKVKRVAFFGIVPTLDGTNKEFATKYVWWFLQIQPEPMPEHLNNGRTSR
jgi:haloacetate dehalogenase